MNTTDVLGELWQKSLTFRAWFYLVSPEETTPGETHLVSYDLNIMTMSVNYITLIHGQLIYGVIRRRL